MIVDEDSGPGLRLAGVAEVADYLAIKPSALADRRRGPDFPEPIARLRCGPIWDLDDIADYAARRREDPRARYRWCNQPGRWQRHFQRYPRPWAPEGDSAAAIDDTN